MSDLRVLAIDDDKDFRDFLESFLKVTDCRFEVTGGASEFRRCYAELEPNVVLLDMVMPDIDGFELMQWLMEQGYGNRVVIVTGFNARYAEMAETLGEDRGLADIVSLTKPVRLAELRKALEIS